MTEAIEKVPAETRWEIATKGLTGACTAIINALKEAVSQEKFDEFQVGLWSQAGKGAKRIKEKVETKELIFFLSLCPSLFDSYNNDLDGNDHSTQTRLT